MSTSTSRSRAARKAVATKKARDAFYTYSPDVYDAARLFVAGYTTHSVADYLGLSVASVAAIRANLNRPGRVRDMALACNF